MIADLPVSWSAVLTILLEGPEAWRTPAEVAAALGRGEPEATDLLCDLDVAGWLTVWDAEPGPLVTLSPLGAERLGARLVEPGPDAPPQWALAGDPEPPAPKARNVCRGARAAGLDFLADPAPGPDAAARRGERADAVARAAGNPGAPAVTADDLPRPSLLVGLGLTPWPGPGAGVGTAPCPACGGRALAPSMYCLYCDRWGLDGVISGSPAGAPAAHPSRPRSDRAGADQAQTERHRARRSRRRRKPHQAGAGADRPGKSSPRPDPFPAPARNPGSRPSPYQYPAFDLTRPPKAGPSPSRPATHP